MQNIFVYGTLLSSGIIKKLTGKSFKTFAAVLPGYKLYRVKNCDYPAIIQNEGSEINGLIIENVNDSSLAVISFYEGDEYEKKQVTVFVNGNPEVALAFVWAKEIELLEDTGWDFREFENNSLEHYINIVIPETLKEFHNE
jgi:gamma-glutamylcyclotransferase (GGCT)/AIG2-like uncharacterized protein YtfP